MLAYPPAYYDAYFVGVPGDVAFYTRRALSTGGRVLELGAGTGRVLLPLAAAGVPVVGIEPDADLLALARQRLSQASRGTRQQTCLLPGRMEELDLGETFAAVLIPYRTFQHLLTPVDQVEALCRIHAHLQSDGLLLMDTFDPLQEMLRDGVQTPLRLDTDFLDPGSGQRVMVWYTRQVDLETQLLEQHLVFEALDADGRSCARTHAQLVLRYTPQQEMIYLLENCGFCVEELSGDFHDSLYPGYGNQVWVARRSAEA